MNATTYADNAAASIAAAIGEPARARMLYCLMDDRARTGTELAVVAEVSPSTASVHLNRLLREGLVKVSQQGKHRYYSLEGKDVATALEHLNVLAGGSHQKYAPNTPSRLRSARTCYDHVAGALGVQIEGRFRALGWMAGLRARGSEWYEITAKGSSALATLGVDLEVARKSRRRFAFPCLDWSERRAHVGGALGAALLQFFLKKKWVVQELDSRALEITRTGRREMLARFQIQI